MKRVWKGAEYTTSLATNDREGWVALQLHKSVQGSSVLAARVVFWDAEGQFSLEVSVDELPLTVVEELIVEARASIPIG